MIIDQTLADELLAKAAENNRLRTNYDLRNSSDDQSQRMLNALMPGTEIPVHRHTSSSETIVILKGNVTEIFFDEDGTEECRYELRPGGPVYGLNIPIGKWHTVVANEPSVILEFKDGAYAPAKPEDLKSK